MNIAKLLNELPGVPDVEVVIAPRRAVALVYTPRRGIPMHLPCAKCREQVRFPVFVWLLLRVTCTRCGTPLTIAFRSKIIPRFAYLSALVWTAWKDSDHFIFSLFSNVFIAFGALAWLENVKWLVKTVEREASEAELVETSTQPER